jgi:hypothetical protein
MEMSCYHLGGYENNYGDWFADDDEVVYSKVMGIIAGQGMAVDKTSLASVTSMGEILS